jgi:tetratricopeptide (TPR) repeat protein
LGTGTLGSTTDRPSATRGTDYGNSAGLIRARGGTSSPLTKLARTDPLYGTRAFLSAVQDDDAILAEREKPITSLVPDRPGKYRDYLAKGERYFRAARYPDALDWFEMASVFDGDDPESLLSITHAKTAMQAYPSAAFSLRKAVRNFPELPLLPLRPSGFYASPLDYSDQLAQLRKYVERNSFDADGHLLLAYYQWFEGETEQAKESLATAHRKAKNLRGKTRETVIEAIDIFWKGMVATGKVSGDLIEKPETDTTTRPAAGEESEDDAPQDGTAEASGQ